MQNAKELIQNFWQLLSLMVFFCRKNMLKKSESFLAVKSPSTSKASTSARISGKKNSSDSVALEEIDLKINFCDECKKVCIIFIEIYMKYSLIEKCFCSIVLAICRLASCVAISTMYSMFQILFHNSFYI